MVWDYQTVSVLWKDVANGGDWVASWANGRTVVGLPVLLNALGATGWELVSVVPRIWDESVPRDGHLQCQEMTLIFKKPRNAV